MRPAALALAALALAAGLTACESSQEENAKLAKVFKRKSAEAADRRALAERGLQVTRPSKVVRVLATSVLRSPEGGGAAIVTLHNSSASTLRNVPIAIIVKSAAGATLYTNSTPGLAATLVSLPLLAAHATTTWVQDQVETSATPASVSARVGEGERDAGSLPQVSVTGLHVGEGGVEGTLLNQSSTAAHEVVLYVIGRRDGKIVAAGNAIVSQAEARSSAHFQAFLVGHPAGAQLEVSVGGAA